MRRQIGASQGRSPSSADRHPARALTAPTPMSAIAAHRRATSRNPRLSRRRTASVTMPKASTARGRTPPKRSRKRSNAPAGEFISWKASAQAFASRSCPRLGRRGCGTRDLRALSAPRIFPSGADAPSRQARVARSADQKALPESGSGRAGKFVRRALAAMSEALSIYQLGKALERAVECLLDIAGKTAAGQLAVLQVFAQTGAAGSLGRAAGIAAGAMGQVLFSVRTVHDNSLW